MPQQKGIVKLKYENHLLNWKEYQAGKIILNSMPSRAFIELTQNCNFKCNMCWRTYLPQFENYNPEYDMSFDLFKKIADSLFPYLTFIDLRGFGETLILPHWPRIVRYIQKFPNIQWHLNTNLSLTRKDVWKLMIKNNFMIAFSCDGATKETFTFIRRGADFEQILKNLKNVVEYIQKFKRGAIYFLVTVQRYNLMELPEIIEMAKDYQVGSIALRIVRRSWRCSLNQPPEIIGKIMKKTFMLAKRYKININVNDKELVKYIPFPLKSYPNPYWYVKEIFPYEPSKHNFEAVSINKKCYKPFGYVYIYYDGKVGPCNHLCFPPVALGDLKENTFKQIWNGEPFQEFRKNLLNVTPKVRDCRWCFKHRITD